MPPRLGSVYALPFGSVRLSSGWWALPRVTPPPPPAPSRGWVRAGQRTLVPYCEPLASDSAMLSKPWVAVLVVREEVEHKLRHRHGITSDQVREAIMFGAPSEARWETTTRHGERLILKGFTYDGVPLIAIVHPID